MSYTVPHIIAGTSRLESACSLSHPITNPATGDVIGRVPFASRALCMEAVENARKAFPDWAATPPIRRARILNRFRELLERHTDELAQIVTREHGKTLEDARGSVARGIEAVEFYSALTSRLQGQFSLNAAGGIDCCTFPQPLGVCAGVSPFNFPVMVPLWMMTPAIACGNTFIIKPSEQDPSATVRLVELLKDAGLPDGVVQCLQGNRETVDTLLAHPDIEAFTAVASTPVAEAIYRTATANGKRAHTFGGAKNHCVVMPDADMEMAADAITGAAFGSAGERCMALSVVVSVGEDSARRLTDALITRVKNIRVGAGTEPDVDMGPLISAAHRERVLAAIDEGVKEGARLLVDGRDFRHKDFPNGFFTGPTLFDEVREDMQIYQQEIFGPVLVMLTVKSFEEALALVNRHAYGNGTAIFTRSGHFAREYSTRVNVGMVGVNIPIPVPVATHPFGGWKRSSFGDTFMHGDESFHFYTRRKSVTSRWPTSREETSAFVMPVND